VVLQTAPTGPATLDRTGPEVLDVLRSLNLRSLDQTDSLETLKKIVLTFEARAAL
jgi:hypothetical protein